MAKLEESRYLNNIFTIAQSAAFKQVAFMVGVVLSVAAGIYVYSAIEDPLYRPLDYKMSEKNASVIADTLDKARIQYKISEHDGVILVAAKDAQLAKYKLSAAGIQKDDSLNFSYLNESNAIGESQFIESARYLRALEGDLVKTLTAIDGIAAAKVHIAMPNNNVFADESGHPTASVFITVGSGLLVDKEKIRSIIQIVASSVPGLDPKHVAITDQYGHYLSNSITDESIQSAEQMSYKNNIQSYYEKRIESLINPLVGENKVSVRVNADIDFTQQEEANEQYDPNQKAIRSEETSTEEVGQSGASGAAGALSNTPPAGGGDASKAQTPASSQGRSQSIKNYELSKSVTYRKSNFAKVTGISVAVVVDNDTVIDPKTKKEVTKPLDKERLDKITELVKATIGYEEKRGDKVTVVNSSFNIIKMDAPTEKPKFWTEAWFWEIIKKVGSILFGFIVFIMLYKKANHYFTTMKDSVGKGSVNNSGDESGLSAEMVKLKQEQINQLKEIASKDPNRVALVIKNWVAEK